MRGQEYEGEGKENGDKWTEEAEVRVRSTGEKNTGRRVKDRDRMRDDSRQ